MTTPSPLRRIISLLVPALLVAALMAVVQTVSAAPATAASGDYACADTVYGTVDNTLYQVATASGTGTSVGTFGASVNALAVAPAGDAAYAMGAISGTGTTGGSANLYKFGTSSAFKQIRGLNAGDSIVGGAFNPLTGHYWFETVNGGTLRFYDVDLTAASPITATIAMSTSTGISDSTGSDFTFDSRGNAYVVYSTSGSGYTNKLMRFTAAQLAAGGAQTGTQMTTLSPNGSQFPGIGFGSDGYIYVTYGTSMYRLAPTNGSLKATLSASRAYNDLGSCATPGVMDDVVKNVVERKAAGDQFKISLSGTDLTTMTGTTTGADLGLQDGASEVAGPTLVLPGSTYTFKEEAAGTTSLANYSATWACTNLNSGATIASGTGTSGSVTIPATTSTGTGAAVTCTITNTVVKPAITLTKTASGTPTKAGDQITYAFTAKNTGNVALTGVTVSDPLLSGKTISCASTSLAVDASTNCTVSSAYTVTQADVNAGTVANTATASATAGSTTVTSTASTSTPITREARLKLVKSASGTPTKAGDKITYSFTVSNTGNTTVTGVGVNDALVTGESCASTSLAPGASTTCTANQYTVTQADVDAGTVNNTAAVTGSGPSGTTLATDSSSTLSTVTPLTRTSQLKIVKAASGTPTKAGDKITYSFTVSNTGNTTVTGVGVNDSLVTGETCSPTTLAPGASATCTANQYTVTQADVDAGTVVNTAAPTGTGPSGASTVAVDPTSTAKTTTAIAAAGGLRVDLEQSAAAVAGKGDQITYRYTVSNTGNVTIGHVAVTDSLGNTITCPQATLAGGASMTCTVTYSVTQAQVDAGSVSDTASVTGTTPSGAPVADDSDRVTKTITPAARLTTTLAQSPGAVTRKGDQITYTATVENTGNVTVDEIVVTDDLGLTYECDVTELAPGESATCTATYAVTQADVDAGEVADVALGSGLTPADATVQDSSDEVTKSIAATAELTTTLVPSGTPTEKGDEVTYTATVENTGNVTVDEVVVTDELGNTYECDVTELAPGESATCTATYTVKQSDVDAGEVVNTATGAGESAGDPVEDDSAEVVTTITADPELTTTLVPSGTPTKKGDEITYTATVENTGNVTVDEVVVTDELGNTYECDVTELAPGESATCTATYTVKQSDVDAGEVVNTANAGGSDPSDLPVEDESAEVETLIEQHAELNTTLLDARTPTRAGDTIAYTMTVANVGNVTVDEIVVTDELGLTYECDVTELAPGEWATCTAIHTVTQADVDAGVVENVADATGADPAGEPVADASNDVDTPIAAAAELTTTLVPSGSPTKKGHEVTYTATVENTGNVTVDEVVVTDGLGLTYECDVTELAPGDSAICIATYPVTQADVNAGVVENTATGAGSTPADEAVADDSDDTRVDIEPGPALTVTLSQSAAAVTSKGDQVTYTYEVENTGNVTVDGIVVTDSLGTTITCEDDELAPGASTTCNSTHTVTQAQVDAGGFSDTATAEGETPADAPVTGTSNTVAKTIAAAAELTTTLVPSGTPTKKGDEVTYTVTVENTGNVTVDELEVTDELGLTYECDVTELAPGESATCAATYSVKQADVDAGEVVNTANAGGSDPSDRAVRDESTEVETTIPARPELTATVEPSGTPTHADDEITYTVTVENTGNVTVDEIVVTDELGNTYECDVTELAPGESATCTATYPVTQDDVDAGEVANTVTAGGTAPSGDPVEDEADEAGEIVTGIAPVPGLTITHATVGALVDADEDGRDSAGDTLGYTYTVENSGNVTLRGVRVTDTAGNTIACDPADLAPGDSAACASDPTPVTQAQVDAGEAVAHGTASATTPAERTVESDDSDDLVTPLQAEDQLAVVTRIASWKDLNGDGLLNTGDQIFYAYDVTNTGTTTVHAIGVSDDRVRGTGHAIRTAQSQLRLAPAAVADASGPTLAPGASTTFVGLGGYPVTAADVQARVIHNRSVAAGLNPRDESVSATSNVVESVPDARARLSLTTHTDIDDVNGNGVTDAGDKVTFGYTVTNTGDVTVEQVTVTDARLAGQDITITCVPTTLAPGESATCTASGPYVVTDEDVTRGSIVSEAVATGIDPVGQASTTVTSNEVETVVATKAAVADAVETIEDEPEVAEQETEERALADAGGPAVAVGALGVVALGVGVTLLGAARRRREDEAA